MCIRDSSITIHVHVGSSGHVLGYGDGATAPSSRGPLQSIAAKRDIANVENELMEIEESEQDGESIEGCMSQSDDSDTGSDEDAVEVLCSLVEGETRERLPGGFGRRGRVPGVQDNFKAYEMFEGEGYHLGGKEVTP